MARSPNYPGVDLKFAVERAQKLWGQQQAHAAASEVVMKNLGYAPKSGPGSTTYGALKRFGLLDEPERGRAQLSPLGVEIVRGENTGQRNYPKLREAALRPKLHKDIWEQYGADLPDSSVLEFDLRAAGFTESGATDFVAQWKRTMAFAKLAEAADKVSDEAAEHSSEGDETKEDVGKNGQSEHQGSLGGSEVEQETLSVPLLGGQWASLRAPFPMSEEAWDHFIKVLETLKPAYTSQAEAADDNQSSH